MKKEQNSDEQMTPALRVGDVSGLLHLDNQDRIKLGNQIKNYRIMVQDIDSVNQLECMLSQIGMLVVKKQ
jgi:hypothetical protein